MKPTKSQELALDMNKSVCVTASAGTGKTFILTHRYIKSLRVGHIDAEKILALTYTDKAAAEMREKIEREIRKESENSDEFKEVIENIHKCSIQTFHGFCASLLKEFPIEAGIEPGFSVMDDLDKSELIETTINDILKNPPEYLKEEVIYLYRYVAPAVIKTSINILLPKWTESKIWFDRLKNNPEEIAIEWREFWASHIRECRDKIISDRKFAEFIESLGKIGDTKAKNRYKEYTELKNTEDISEIYKNIKKLKSNIEGDSDIESFLKKINIYDINELRDENLERVFRVMNCLGDVVSYTLEKIDSEKERAAVLDFDDLVRFTSKLMEKEDVIETLRERYEYILVDEVQDNDPILTGIVKKICGNAVEKGRLFIVGDVKQSIYRFRGSDPQGFFDLMSMFSSEPVSLDKSFRTVPEIIDSVNKIFTDVFADSKIKYSGVTTSREADSGTVTILNNIPVDKKLNAEEEADLESMLIASWLKENIGKITVYENGEERPSKYSDAAILLRTRTRMDYLKNSLEKYGVPYYEYKGRDFYKSQEIYDIVNVLKATAFPEDDCSLYGALRSPYFGISDELLCRVSSKDTDKPLISRLNNSDEPEIISALNLRNRFSKLSHELTLAGFVNEIIRISGILSVYSGQPSGSGKIANLEKFADMISAKTVGTPVSLPAFLKTADTCIDEGIAEESGSDDDSDDSNRVKILTIHASKGLEYPIVIVAFASKERKTGSGNICIDSKLGASLTFNIEGDKKIKSFVYEITKDKINLREDEEGKRLYYVGLTRARDHLVVSKTDSEKYDETSFIGIHDIEGGEIISECCCTPEIKSDCGILEPKDWEEILPESDSEGLTESDKINVDEYLLAKGSCLHEIFAGADIAETAKRYGLSDCADEFSKDLEEFMNCELMEGVVESHCELQVSFGDENKRIDRLVKYADGSYSIIDYKLGSREGISDELAEKYKQQLTRYSELMTEILGCDVSAYLYFVGGKDKEKIVKIR